jgi:putative DNA primase/helicase
VGSPLTAADLAMLAKAGIDQDTAERAGWRRVTHAEARDGCGIRYKSNHLEGIAIPHVDPANDQVRTWRVRRDHPEMDSDGQPIGKYLSPPDRRHLYFAPDSASRLADLSAPCVIVEAAKSVLALVCGEAKVQRRHLTIGTGGCWGWKGVTGKTTAPDGTRVDVKGMLRDFDKVTWTGRPTIIVFDSNVATNPKVQAARRQFAAELERRGAAVRVVDLPVEPGINGPDDYIGTHGAAAFFALVDAAKPLPKAKTKAAKPEKPKQGQDVLFEELDPWPEPVNGATVLFGLAETFNRYLALPAHAAVAIALWVLHAYTFRAWFTTPFLVITSPAKRCGKTLLLIILGALVPRRLFAANVTAAVLFRAIEKFKPTLLIDEADTFMRENEELRGVMNSGHTRTTAIVIRAVGDDHDPRAFSTWCAKAIALIGKLPGTLDDRSIEIRMRRRLASERVDRLRQDRIGDECFVLRRMACRWADDATDALKDADPVVPDALHDRAADCWRPLLAIADAAGGDWPALARQAAKAISGATDADGDATTLLLRDIRAIFKAANDPDVMGSAAILEHLVELEDRPWSEWSKGEPLTGAKLARMLKSYDVLPAGTVRVDFKTKLPDGTVQVESKTAKGYRFTAFADAWSRYLGGQHEAHKVAPQPDGDPSGGAKASQRNNVNESGELSPFAKGNTPIECDALRSVTNPMNTERCYGVTDRHPPDREKETLPTPPEVTRVHY